MWTPKFVNTMSREQGDGFEIHAIGASTKNLWTSLNFSDLDLKVRGDFLSENLVNAVT